MSQLKMRLWKQRVQLSQHGVISTVEKHFSLLPRTKANILERDKEKNWFWFLPRSCKKELKRIGK